MLSKKGKIAIGVTVGFIILIVILVVTLITLYPSALNRVIYGPAPVVPLPPKKDEVVQAPIFAPPAQVSQPMYDKLAKGETIELTLADGTKKTYNSSMGIIDVWLITGNRFFYNPTIKPPPPSPATGLPAGSKCPVKNCGPGSQDATTCACVCPTGYEGANCRIRSGYDYHECIADKSGTLVWANTNKCLSTVGGCPADRKQVCNIYATNVAMLHDPQAKDPFECTAGADYIGPDGKQVYVGDSVTYTAGHRCMMGSGEPQCMELLAKFGCKSS